MFEHLFERLKIEVIPFSGYLFLNFVEHRLGNFRLHPSHPGLEGFESHHRFIHAMARIKASERCVREIPLTGIETKALIDHLRLITCFILCSREDRLPAVCVAGPLIEYKHPAKISEVKEVPKLLIGKEVVNHDFHRRSRIAGSEL